MTTRPETAAMAASDSSGNTPGVEDDQRKTDRLPLLGDFDGEIVVFQPMTIKEIGLGGVQIESATPLHIDSLHDVRLHLGDRSVIVKGRVVHCSVVDVNDELVHYRTGLEFVELPPHVADVIGTFIAAVRAARQAE